MKKKLLLKSESMSTNTGFPLGSDGVVRIHLVCKPRPAGGSTHGQVPPQLVHLHLLSPGILRPCPFSVPRSNPQNILQSPVISMAPFRKPQQTEGSLTSTGPLPFLQGLKGQRWGFLGL